MATSYVCPSCLHSLNNQPLALPPVRPLTTCSHCGCRVVQSVGCIARAWMTFFGVWTVLIVYGLWALGVTIIIKSLSQYGKDLFFGVFLAMLAGMVACFLGWLVGTVVGLVVGGSWWTRRISGMDTLKAMAAADASYVHPALVPMVPKRSVNDSQVTVTKRCWHCGYVLENATFNRWTQIQCPQCRSHLGCATTIRPSSDE